MDRVHSPPESRANPWPSGIVFDLDGTLLLSHHDFPRMRATIVEVAERFGLPPGAVRSSETVGTSRVLLATLAELRARQCSEAELRRFTVEVGKRLDAIELEATDRATTRPGALNLLEGARARGIRLGLFTRSSNEFCQTVLPRLQLDPYFRYRRTRSAPGPVKPSPEALLLLLREMGIRPEEALYVGDHFEDAECARGAGVRFVGILPAPGHPGTATAEGFRERGAAAVISGLPELVALLEENSLGSFSTTG